MSIHRRDLLRLAAAATVAPALSSLAGCDDDAEPAGPAVPEYSYDGEPGPVDLFQHGVASGDPLPDRVILWTRVTQTGDAPVPVFWEMALDAEFTERVAAGDAEAGADADFTVKVDPEGLSAGTTYYYRFWSLGRVSPTGRTRTAPEGALDRLTLGVVSCAALENGFLHAYQGLAEMNVDAVVHLGDYIYEYGNDGGFAGSPKSGYFPEHEVVTLSDYRLRYGWYRLKPQLQAVHAAHPMICVWDDHESANDSWSGGAQNHDEETEGGWAERRAAASQVWHEWLPVRPQAEAQKIWRRFQFGDLVDLIMLDTRIWGRDEKNANPDVRLDPDRQMLGADQADWLDASLAESTAAWRLIGQQVMMAPLVVNGIQLNNDQWDGYPAARERLLTRAAEVGDVVVLTGDIHSSWANEIPMSLDDYEADGDTPAAAVEFVAPAISAFALPFLNDQVVRLLTGSNPHIKYFELTMRGFMRVDVTPERVHADWYHYPDIEPETVPPPMHGAAYQVASGTGRLVQVDAEADPR